MNTADSPSSIRKGQLRGRQVDADSLAAVKALLGDAPRRKDLLIEYLHRIQDRYHQLAESHLVALADELKLAPAEVFEVATFYHHFDVVSDDHPAPELTVRVCDSLSCELFGARQLLEQLQQTSSTKIKIQPVPCVGRCHAAPVAVVGEHPVEHASVDKVTQAVAQKQTTAPVSDYIDYEPYGLAGGYDLYRACQSGERPVDAIIEALKQSGLRGLGGAGFPAASKWEILRQQARPKVLAVNIDEGEPGTFKDRYYLERDPHRLIEGALIAAWAVDAQAVFIYLRDEYAGCRRILHNELDKLRQKAPFTLPEIHLRRGAGAYICGEESAMLESIEGKRGMPRLRPPYVAQVGLFGWPTLAHNMETLYWVREIIEKGPDWFSTRGVNGRKGLRSFSISGRVQRPGVHLAPAGITMNALLEEYCGGMLDGHRFYAYFPGGASGGILPASMAEIPLDFDTLQEHGCFIGSAAIIVLSDQDRVRNAAQSMMRFFAHESCGQCTPCRVGTAKAQALMQQKNWDQPLLRELAGAMSDASICGLGQAAPNPLLCAMRYFPEEFDDER